MVQVSSSSKHWQLHKSVNISENKGLCPYLTLISRGRGGWVTHFLVVGSTHMKMQLKGGRVFGLQCEGIQSILSGRAQGQGHDTAGHTASASASREGG